MLVAQLEHSTLLLRLSRGPCLQVSQIHVKRVYVQLYSFLNSENIHVLMYNKEI